MRTAEARSRALRLALLGVVLALVVVVHSAPYFDVTTGRRSEAPVHMDEYVHWGYARAAVEQGTIAFGDPFTGQGPAPYSPTAHLHERGFHAYLGSFQELSGVPFPALLAALPVAVALALALAAYALAEPWGAGVEAAMWTAVVPTTLRFLGPGFAVPIGFALPLVLIGLAVAFHGRSVARVFAASLLLAALWTIHAMGALALTVTLTLVALLRARTDLAYASGLLLALAIPVMMALPYATQYSTGDWSARTPDLPPSLEDVRRIGWPLPLLASAGAAALALRRDPLARSSGAALAVAAFAFGGVLVARLMTERDPLKLYDRSVTVFATFCAVLAGVGTSLVLRRVRVLRSAAWPVALVLAVASVALVAHEARDNFGQDHYAVLPEGRAAAYAEAGEALEGVPGLAIVEGISTMAFTDVTGRPTLFVRLPGDAEDPPFSQRFFADGAEDTFLLVRTGTTVVVTDRAVTNPDLRMVAPGVYVLEDHLLRRMYPAYAGAAVT